MITNQTKFWSGQFGKEYTDRNSRFPDEWDQFYIDTYGITKMQINEVFLSNVPKNARILEIGCNTGMQLACLQRMGFENLYGVELQPYAVEKAKEYTAGINIIQGSGFDIPFKDTYFDLVCTNGVLIHIAPDDLDKFMSEIVRVTKNYIMGFEYFSDEMADINYRGNQGFLWKANYPQIFQDSFKNVKLIKKELFPYKNQPDQKDVAYLIQKN